MKTPFNLLPEPSPDDVERALAAFHRGSTAELEALLGESDQSDLPVVKLLRSLINQASGQDMHDHGPWSK